MRTSRRLYAETWTLRHQTLDQNGKPNGHIAITLSVVVDEKDPKRVVEAVFNDTGKTGTGITILLADIGVWVSRLLQNRHPETGEELYSEENRDAEDGT